MSIFACGFNGFSQLTSAGSVDGIVTTPIALYRDLLRSSSGIASPSTAPGTKGIVQRRGLKVSRISLDLKDIVISWDRVCFLWTNGTITSFGGPIDENDDDDYDDDDGSIFEKLPFENVKLASLSANWQKFLGVDVDGLCQVLRSRCKMTPLEFKRSDGISNEQVLNVKAVYSCESGTTVIHHSDSFISVGELQRGGDCILLRPLRFDVCIKSVSCGKHHVLMVSAIGVIFSLGNGSQGQLGHGTVASEPEPRILEALEGVTIVQATAGGWHSMALSDIGDVYVWGWNEKGQLGLPCRNLCSPLNTSNIQKKNLTMLDNSHVENSCHSGDHSVGFLDKTSSSRSDDTFVNLQTLPVVLDLTAGNPTEVFVRKIGCGSRHSVAALEDGSVFSWGFNDYGQLGHGDKVSRDRPKIVDFFLERRLFVDDVFCGFWNTVFVTQDVTDAEMYLGK